MYEYSIQIRQHADTLRFNFIFYMNIGHADKGNFSCESILHSQIEFHHLPQKAMKMEFTIVPDIRKEEIMDYAIVSGDNPNDLTIQVLCILSSPTNVEPVPGFSDFIF